METAQDLLQCIANDVGGAMMDDNSDNEALSVAATDGSLGVRSVGSQELGLIIEEKCSGNKDLASNVWVEDETSNWKRNGVSPTVWYGEADSEQPEDILADWHTMLRKTNSSDYCSDINKVFWEIICKSGNWRRRISQVLENLPFDDHPDIFQDRCEILESNGTITAKRDKEKFGKQIKKMCLSPSYWNIFQEWKWNLRELPTGVKKRKRQRRKNRPHLTKRKPILAKEEMEGDKKKSKRRRHRRKRGPATPETIFNESLHMFVVPRGRAPQRRRSRDDMEQGRGARLELQQKLPKSICKATVAMEECTDVLSLCSTAVDLPKMSNLRGEESVREVVCNAICQDRRKHHLRVDELAFFADWRLITLDAHHEDWVEVGRVNNTEDIFQDWLHNLERQERGEKAVCCQCECCLACGPVEVFTTLLVT